MPTTHPRLLVTLDEELYKALKRISRKNGVSLSRQARELIEHALEEMEDYYWSKRGEKALKEKRPRIDHETLWKKLVPFQVT